MFGLGTISTWPREQGYENACAEQRCVRTSAQKPTLFVSKVLVLVNIKFRDNRLNVPEIYIGSHTQPKFYFLTH